MIIILRFSICQIFVTSTTLPFFFFDKLLRCLFENKRLVFFNIKYKSKIFLANIIKIYFFYGN